MNEQSQRGELFCAGMIEGLKRAAEIAEQHRGGFNQAHDRLCGAIANAIRSHLPSPPTGEQAEAALTPATKPVARAYVRLEDDGLEADLEVLDGSQMQVEHSPVDLYLHPAPKVDVELEQIIHASMDKDFERKETLTSKVDVVELREARFKFADAVWNALKADASDLRKQQRIIKSFDVVLASLKESSDVE